MFTKATGAGSLVTILHTLQFALSISNPRCIGRTRWHVVFDKSSVFSVYIWNYFDWTGVLSTAGLLLPQLLIRNCKNRTVSNCLFSSCRWQGAMRYRLPTAAQPAFKLQKWFTMRQSAKLFRKTRPAAAKQVLRSVLTNFADYQEEILFRWLPWHLHSQTYVHVYLFKSDVLK